MKKIFIMFMVITTMLSACSNKDIDIDTSEIEVIAINLVQDLIDKKYDDAYNNYNYTSVMEKTVSPEFYEKEIGPVLDQYGEFIEMKNFLVKEDSGYIIISIPIVFSNDKINYNVVFDKSNDIAGIHLAPYEEGTEANVSGDIKDIALEYVKDLLNEKYEDAYNNHAHDAVMTKQVSPDFYKSIMENLKKQQGDFVEIKTVFSYEFGEYTIVAVPIVFSKESVNIQVVFDKSNLISGINFAPYQEYTSIDMPDGIIEKEIVANVNGYELGGTLTLPKDGDNFPCVVLVHGSGASDRDETIFMNKPFRDIAWELAKQGIAVYRYDKRNFVYPDDFVTNYNFTIYDETINDAVEIVNMLRDVPELNKDDIYVLGHSLGGYAIPRIADNSPEAAGFIIMAGPARPLYELIPYQYEYILGLDGSISDEDQKTINLINAEVAKLDNIDDLKETDIVLGMYKAYVKDIISYNPIEVAKSIDKPVLVLQGERDYQVTMVDYNLWNDAFSNSNNWSFKLYPSLNHLMMPGEGKPTNEEYKVQNNVDNTVINDIVNFIMK